MMRKGYNTTRRKSLWRKPKVPSRDSVVRMLAGMCIGIGMAFSPMAAHAGHSYHFKPIDKQFDAIASEMDKMDYKNEREHIDKAKIRQLQAIAERTGNSQLQSRAAYWYARAIQMDSSPQTCIPILEKAKTSCGDDYDYDRARIDYQLAGNYERLGQYLNAYNLLNATLPTFESHGDHYFLGNAYLLMVQLFCDINDPDNARQMLALAKENYTKAGFDLNRVFFFEANLSEQQSQKIKYYKLSLQSGGDHDWGMTLQALNALSTIFQAQGRTDSARVYTGQAMDLLKRKAPDNPLFQTLVNITYINLLYHEDNCAEALKELHSELQKEKMMKGERFLVSIYELLWKVNEKAGNEAEAYKWLKLYMKEYTANEETIKKQDIPKARAREAIARRNDTIKLLEQDAELARRLTYVAVLALVVILLAGVALFIYFYQRYKIRRIENRELRNSLRQEALIYSTNRKNFEDDMKRKECEISSNTLLLANKNEVLQQISEITRDYYNDGKIPQEYVSQVNAVIGDSLKNDDEWQRFKLHFDSVHPNFFVKLKEASDKLTENDLRLCAYIAIGMRAKQIAEMLSVSPDSVNTSRYRLRKKLGLQRGENLDECLRRL